MITAASVISITLHLLVLSHPLHTSRNQQRFCALFANSGNSSSSSNTNNGSNSTSSGISHRNIINDIIMSRPSASQSSSPPNNNGDDDDNGGDKIDDNDGWQSVPLRRNRPQRKVDESSSASEDVPIPQVEYIEPTDENTSFNPFMVMLVGIPGSGKSTFARALEQAMPYKYVRINQDELGNRRACEALCRQTIDAKKCPIIDRCNFDEKQRRVWTNIANEELSLVSSNGRADVYVVSFDSSVTTCIKRCQQRAHHETVSPHEAAGIVRMMHNSMERVNGDRATYSGIYRISNPSEFQQTLVALLNRK
eukprot:CAMPEP_0119554576 /NCGR_PEP_ID=MMETSP1352-20130426/7032_1 /TAXON_ID=265584 /ORGANISM="Stauroneis constricta, Strain CCMP1120" /LENGTH=307 /DNA_ID=CAMNT_0007601189 /DNA_START=23 /DNA_END=946 /DNA_ORIENTATION=+